MRKFEKVIFPDELILKYAFGHGGDWELQADFRVFWTDSGKEHQYKAEAGLITDMASIPGWAQSVIHKEADSAKASIIHDHIYENRPADWTRKGADRLLYAGLRASGMNWFKAKSMYLAVRVGGQKVWEDD